MLPQMFCVPGMTSYRALFDMLGIPYVGNPPDVMALGADKAKAKAVVAAAGVACPAGEVLRAGERPALDPPVVVKPVDADNSLGVTLVRNRDDYDAALETASRTPTRCSWSATSSSAARSVRHRSSGTASWSACPSRSTTSTPPRPSAARRQDRPDRRGELELVAKDSTKAWIVDPGDPVTRRGVGRGDAAVTSRWAAGTTASSTSASTPRATVVPRGGPVLLVRPQERHPDDGGRRRNPPR